MTQYRNCTGFGTETVSTWIQKLYRSTGYRNCIDTALHLIQKLYSLLDIPMHYTYEGIRKMIFQHEIQWAVP